jgi:hypothetical protein
MLVGLTLANEPRADAAEILHATVRARRRHAMLDGSSCQSRNSSLEAAQSCFLGIESFKHRCQLRDIREISNPLDDVEHFELTALPSHDRVRSDDTPEAPAVDV